jgi:hypothetical protein
MYQNTSQRADWWNTFVGFVGEFIVSAFPRLPGSSSDALRLAEREIDGIRHDLEVYALDNSSTRKRVRT